MIGWHILDVMHAAYPHDGTWSALHPSLVARLVMTEVEPELFCSALRLAG